MSDMPGEEVSVCMKEIGCEPNVLGWRLLIKSIEVPEQTKGGIILPDSNVESKKRRQNMGLVLKIGKQAFSDRFEHLRCEEGDYVHYSILEREPVYANGHSCYYINDDKIQAILKPEEVSMFLDDRK